MFCFKRPEMRSVNDDESDDDDEEEKELYRGDPDMKMLMLLSLQQQVEMGNRIPRLDVRRSVTRRSNTSNTPDPGLNPFVNHPRVNRMAIHKRSRSVDTTSTTASSSTAPSSSSVVVPNYSGTTATNFNAQLLHINHNHLLSNQPTATTTSDPPTIRHTNSSGSIQVQQRTSFDTSRAGKLSKLTNKSATIYRKLLYSFSPPSALEDLSDEIEVQVENVSIERIASPPVIGNIPTTERKRSFKSLLLNSRKKQKMCTDSVRNEEYVNNREEQVNMNSGLLRSQVETHSPVVQKMRKISIFVPHRTHGVHRVLLLAPHTSLMRNLVKEALTRYTNETKLEPVQSSPTGYSLHAAEESGCIDYDYPKFDVTLDSLTLAKLPISRFVIQPMDNYLSVSRLFYERKENNHRIVNLQDVRMRVVLRYLNTEKIFWQVFAPDLLLRDAEKYLKKRLLPDLMKTDDTNNSTNNNDASDPQPKKNDSNNDNNNNSSRTEDFTLTVQLLENTTMKRCIITKTIGKRSIKELNSNITIFATIHYNDQNNSQSPSNSFNSKYNNSPARVASPVATASTTNSTSNNIDERKKRTSDTRFFIPRFIPIDYREYSVIKINKYGRRQERIFAIDDKKIYNKLPYSHAGYNFLGLPTKTRKPERPIETLVNIITYPAKPLCFTTVFDDETLYWEAGTVVEKNEIVNTLKNLKWNSEKQTEDYQESDQSNTMIPNYDTPTALLKVLRSLSPGPEDEK